LLPRAIDGPKPVSARFAPNPVKFASLASPRAKRLSGLTRFPQHDEISFMDVKSASRTLDVFELFAREQRPLTLSELAAALDAPLSSCFNLVRALKGRGFLFGVGARRQIYPTRKMYDVASAISASEPWLRRMMPRLEALRDQTQETAILGKEQGGRVIYLAVLEGPQNIRYTARPGDLKPLHSSSIGKTLLATMKPRARADVLAKLPLDAMTDATITDRARLVEEIERSAAQGYSITRGENVADVMAVAMPVKVAGDTYGIAVAGPMHRMTEQIADHQRRLAEICKQIERDL
jgi:IclR family transcriptional regulator, acetate operon repressor